MLEENNNSPNVDPWPPNPPDMASSAAYAACDPQHLAVNTTSEVFKFKNYPKIYKAGGTQQEYELMIAAGACSIQPYGRSLRQDSLGNVKTVGILMELGTPLDPKTMTISQRKALIPQMISVVRVLHQKGIVHGDIKPANMLLRADGRLCLCDFGEGRRAVDDPESWEGMVTDHYSSPNRCRNWPDGADPAPEIVDDLYALGLSIWELFTERMPFTDWYVDDILDLVKTGETVDVNEVEDEGVREIIREYLRYGGAKV